MRLKERDFRPYAGAVWRLVEAQHRISTNRLAADADDQRGLEDLVEEVKPTLPRAARGLHYLLATPFRYGHSRASRFRRASDRPGIFYASETEATAVAETAYWRLRFLSRSPGMMPSRSVTEHSAFTVGISVDRAIDLTVAPFARSRKRWMDPDDHGPCQDLAVQARTLLGQGIRYTSVRDPEHRANFALLDPSGFSGAPRIEQTWHLRYEAGQLTAFAAFPSPERHIFSFAQYGLIPPERH